ncbi:DUF2442 domain-containing protein [Candidatus Saccharibacteria bacterium]|nr:DUF2442 domain-containing protein [Candidatus Saccharibacteria bacterium]
MFYIKDGIAYQEKQPVILHVSTIEPLPGYHLRATFPDGTVKIYDCSPLLETEAFNPLKDEKKFKKVSLDFGVPTWEDANVDLSPETIYLNGK